MPAGLVLLRQRRCSRVPMRAMPSASVSGGPDPPPKRRPNRWIQRFCWSQCTPPPPLRYDARAFLLSISAFATCIENSLLIGILTYILLYDIIRTSIQCTFYTNEEFKLFRVT